MAAQRSRPVQPAGGAPTGSSLLLAIETATPFASVAVLAGDVLRAELTITGPRSHSARLLPAIEAVLALCGLDLDALDGFALSIGPGSFTGLRIGLSTLKGLAFGDLRPVAAVPTLAALARSAAASPHPVLACLDARRGEVYAALYAPGAEAEAPLLEEGVYDAAALARRLPRPCTVVGCAGEEPLHDQLRQQLGPDLHWAVPQIPRAAHVGQLGARLLLAGRGLPAAQLAPRYLRRAEAEVRRTGQRFEAPAGRDPLL